MANPAEPLRYGQLGAGGRVHVESDGVHVTDEAGTDRVQMGRLPSGDYGLQVVNAGATVIIDGSSNMFKILASGTLDATAANPGASPTGFTTATDSVTLTGLGTFTETPGVIAFVGTDFATTNNRVLGFNLTFVSVDEHDIIGMKSLVVVVSKLNGSSQAVVELQVRNFIGGSTHRGTCRYHLVKEAAI